jgi:acylphosphatase
MVEACRRGPPGARIDSIEQSDAGRDALAQRRAGERFSLLATV